MTRTVIVTAVVFAALAAAALAANAALTGGPPCTPKATRIGGQPVATMCGPATATVRAGGRTYTFHNGFCEQSKATGDELKLDMGTFAPTFKGNQGKPELNLLASPKIGGTVGAHYGGKLIANNLVDIAGRFPTQGTFNSKISGSRPGETFSGSWNCHGVVWQAP
jgi:hypothetical protein